jgi:hypothetical protein
VAVLGALLFATTGLLPSLFDTQALAATSALLVGLGLA